MKLTEWHSQIQFFAKYATRANLNLKQRAVNFYFLIYIFRLAQVKTIIYIMFTTTSLVDFYNDQVVAQFT